MLSRFNGTTEPTDIDRGWLTLWSTDELAAASTLPGYGNLTSLVTFADHGLSSWWYAIEALRSDGSPSRVFMLAREPEIIAESLEVFLRAVVAADPILYGLG
jgi:hypothetical protein